MEDMNAAIALSKMNSYSFRVVTVKGDIINPSGVITGGSVSTKTVNILGRSREIEELEKDVKRINKNIENINNKKDEYSTSITDVIEEVRQIRQVACKIFK